MKKIVITGATSMIGTALMEVAVKNNTEVYAIVRPTTQRKDRLINDPLVHIIYGDLANLRDIKGVPTDCDALYHFAWVGTDKKYRDDVWMHESNIRYTLDAVELAEKAGCKKFIGAGSQAEYGSIYGERIDENMKYNPVISYGIGKFAAGALSKKLCDEKKIGFAWGRIFSVYGPHDNEGTMLNYAINCFLNGEIAHFSTGNQIWNYLYEKDAGEMFFRLGDDDVPSGTYLIANTESMILKEYIRILTETFGIEAKAEFAEDTGQRLPDIDVDVRRTIETIGFTPQVDFKEGIMHMINAKRIIK